MDDDDDVVGVAERLLVEFPALSPVAVLEVVSACVEECGRACTLFLEQAARARLLRLILPTPSTAS